MIKVCEYVSFGHPDKIADQISDALLDEYLKQDKNSRCGIETMVKDNVVVIGGEVHSNAVVNHEEVIKNVYETIKFPPNHNLTSDNLKIINLIGQQSQEIHNGVDKETEIGAGDQGLMYGYACDETPTYMPLGSYLSKKICDDIASLNEMEIGPDVKTQVIIDYDENGKSKVLSILVSAMHQCSIELMRDIVSTRIKNNLVGIDEKIFVEQHINEVKLDINPCGSWNIGGPISDCGVTGRKLVVDNYGSYCEIGGGAASSKDMTKVDRSAAYMARYIAKNIVANGLAKTAKVSLSYMIGVAKPCSFDIILDDNTNKNKIIEWVLNNVDLTPSGIINRFNGTEPQYLNTARYGHYGNNSMPWEKNDLKIDI